MDIVLGVSMAPMAVRMVLVEGVKGDGLTVDHDAFDIAVGDSAAKSSPDQVIDAILGTRESAAEGGHRLSSIGVAWTDHGAAAELKEALRTYKLDDVILVSELHAAGALAQAVGRAVGYERTALLLVDGSEATLAVVETATGTIVKVKTQTLGETFDLVAKLETLDEPPQGLFIVGFGADIAAAKAQIAQRTALPVHAPEEPELALARGAALASANTPRYEASTVGVPYEPQGEPTQMAAGLTQRAEAGYMAPLGYSAVSDFESELDGLDSGLDDIYDERSEDIDGQDDEAGRKPFLLVGSALASVFVVGVVALVISLSVSIRPTVDQRPAPGAGVIAPTSAVPALIAPQAQVPEPAPAPPVETIQAPQPVVQEAPRTVYVTPAPQAPAQVIAPPAPTAVPGDVPAAPAPAPVPVAPVPEAPPVVVIPAPIPLPIFQPPNVGNWPFPTRPRTPQTQTTQTPATQTEQPEPTTQQPVPTTQQPEPTTQQPTRQQPTQQPQPAQEQPAPAATTQAPSSGGSSSGGESSSSSSGSRSSGSGSSRSGIGSSRGSGGSGGGSSSGGSPLWPWPTN